MEVFYGFGRVLFCFIVFFRNFFRFIRIVGRGLGVYIDVVVFYRGFGW